ncbi:hypothetical protein Q0F98_28595 [Paenibacillus amylolyticus]|nr:hypothetical protein Q0F98_28595 [Paenibacillus amylolyticus]
MKKPSELLSDIVDALRKLEDGIDDKTRSTSEILENLSSFSGNGLYEIIHDIDDAKDAAEEIEEELDKANDRIEELENE